MPVLQAEGGGLVGEAELPGPRPQGDYVGRGGARLDQRDGLVHVLPAADIGVALCPGRAADRERPVVARPVAVIAVQNVEERRVAGRKYWTAGGALDTLRESQSNLNTAAGRGEMVGQSDGSEGV